MEEDIIINYGIVISSKQQKKGSFAIRWQVETPYKGSNTTWMIGKGSASKGAKYKLYQDSDNNGLFNKNNGDTYVGFGRVSPDNYGNFKSVFQGGTMELTGYANFTADLYVGGQKIGSMNWF